MVKTLAIRNYFETHGSFINIKNDMKGRVANMTEEDLYATLGFTSYKEFSGKEVFMIRKLYLQGNLDQAMKRGNFKNEEDLFGFLIESYNFYIPYDKVQINNYVEMISTYIKEVVMYNLTKDVNNTPYLEGVHDAFTSELNRKLKQVEKVRNEGKFISGITFNKKETAFFNEFWSLWAPKFVVVKNEKPKIVDTTMIIPKPLDEETLDFIKQLVNLSLVLNMTTVPPELVWDYLNYCSVYNFTELLDNTNNRIRTIYTLFLDLSLARNITIKELLESFGANIIEYWKQYSDTKCIFMLQNENAVKYCNGNEWKSMDLRDFYNNYSKNNLMNI